MGRAVVQRGDEAAGDARVGARDEVGAGSNREAPGALAVSDADHGAFVVAFLEVVGVEAEGVHRGYDNAYRTVGDAFVVPGGDVDVGVDGGAVLEDDEALGAPGDGPRGGEVGQDEGAYAAELVG